MFAPWQGDDYAPLLEERRTDKPRQTAAVSRAKPFPFRAAQSRVRQLRAPSIGEYIRRRSHKDRGAKSRFELRSSLSGGAQPQGAAPVSAVAGNRSADPVRARTRGRTRRALRAPS